MTIMGSDMTKEEFRQLCKTAWENSMGLKSLILAVKRTMINIEVGWSSFTYQIKLIFSLKNEESS